MIALGIDAGASSTKWALLRDGVEIAHGSAGPMTGHLFDARALREMARTVRAIAAAVRRSGAPETIMAGVTGLAIRSKTALLYRMQLARAFGVRGPRVSVVNDMEIAYRAAFAPGEGILVYAGTGSIAYHVRANGLMERAGGHGYLIDDAGGGFWIGQQALRAVMRARDAGEPRSALDRRVSAAISGSGWDDLRAHVYGGGRASVAALTHAAAHAARRDGDEVAQEIFYAAGAELARLARVMIARIGKKPVALAGGVLAASPLVFEGFRASLPRNLTVRAIESNAALVAAQLAATPSGARARNSPGRPRRIAR